MHLLNGNGACAYTIEGPDRDKDEPGWAIGRVSFSPDDYIKIRKFIELVCTRQNACDNKWEKPEGDE